MVAATIARSGFHLSKSPSLCGPNHPPSKKDVSPQKLCLSASCSYRNFVDTFHLHHKKIYIAGESFAGKYIPYIANAMLNTNDTEYYNVEGILLYDPSLSSVAIQQDGK